MVSILTEAKAFVDSTAGVDEGKNGDNDESDIDKGHRIRYRDCGIEATGRENEKDKGNKREPELFHRVKYLWLNYKIIYLLI